MHNTQIRKSVFETNSSSSHSLTLGKGDLVAQPFSKSVLRQGVLALSAGEYGWEWKRYYTPAKKLRYLVTQLTNGAFSDDIDAQCEDNPQLAMLRRVVKEHTGCDIALALSSGYIDHQSSAEEKGTGLSLFKDEDKLKQFIFDANSYIETGNDNSPAPWLIGTDKGASDLYHAEYLRPVPEAFKPVVFSAKARNYDNGLFTPAGALVSSVCNADLHAELMRHGVVSAVSWSGSSFFDPFEHADVRDYSAARLVDHLFDDGEGLHLSEHMTAKSSIKVVSYDRARKGKRPEEVLGLTVMVPEELAAALGALKRTPAPMVNVYRAQTALAQLKERSKKSGERPSAHLKKVLAEDQATLEKLEAKAKKQGLM